MRAEMREAIPWPTICCTKLSPTAMPPVMARWAPIERASLTIPRRPGRPPEHPRRSAARGGCDLGDDEDDVEDGARADRRHQRHALRGVSDFALGLVVEVAQKRAFGDVDEVAPVDDRARGVCDLSAGVRRFGPVAVERHELADKAARRLAVVGGAGGCEGDMHLGDFPSGA